eukprot:gene17394-17223_t
MTTKNMRDAKAQLSRLIDALESGAEKEIILTRNGRPAARLVPMADKIKRPVRLGLAKGLFEAPPFPDGRDEEAAALFFGEHD